MSWLRAAVVSVLVLALAGWEPFKSPDEDVTAGNQAYAEGRYDDAIAAYERARKRGIDGPSLDYNVGTTQLRQAEATQDPARKQKLTEDAMAALDRAAQKAPDARIRSQASYNRGNALLGGDKLEDAIKEYKQALKTDPSFEDARMNLELALKKRERKQRQQQQGQGQGQPQQGQGQGQQQPQQGQGQGQGQQQQPQQGQGQGQGQQQQQQQGQGQGQGSQQQQQGQGQGSQQQQQGQGQGSQQQQQQQGQGQGSQQQQQQQGQGQGQGSQQQQQQQQQQGQGQGQQQQQQQQGQQGQQGQQQGSPGQQRYRGPRQEHPQGPQTPSERKLDQLEEQSRSMQRNRVRGNTWRGTWSDKDW